MTVGQHRLEQQMRGEDILDALVAGDEEAWAREQLQGAVPEFVRHFTNADYPVLRIRAEVLTFADRPNKIRSHLILREGGWVSADET